MTAPDLSARADRVKSLVESWHGKVLSRAGNTMTVEIPADVAPGMASMWGMGGYSAIFRSQDTHLAPRRVANTQGQTVVCENDMVTTAFYRYAVDLQPNAAHRAFAPTPENPAPVAQAITAPTKANQGA